MADCSNCHRKMGVFAKKYAGYGGERLCGPCALSQQKKKYAERLEYMLKQVQAFPQHIEPLRDCEMEMQYAELLLASKKPLSASRSREMAKVKSHHHAMSTTELQHRRQAILEQCRKVTDQLRRG